MASLKLKDAIIVDLDVRNSYSYVHKGEPVYTVYMKFDNGMELLSQPFIVKGSSEAHGVLNGGGLLFALTGDKTDMTLEDLINLIVKKYSSGVISLRKNKPDEIGQVRVYYGDQDNESTLPLLNEIKSQYTADEETIINMKDDDTFLCSGPMRGNMLPLYSFLQEFKDTTKAIIELSDSKIVGFSTRSVTHTVPSDLDLILGVNKFRRDIKLTIVMNNGKRKIIKLLSKSKGPTVVGIKNSDKILTDALIDGGKYNLTLSEFILRMAADSPNRLTMIEYDGSRGLLNADKYPKETNPLDVAIQMSDSPNDSRERVMRDDEFEYGYVFIDRNDLLHNESLSYTKLSYFIN